MALLRDLALYVGVSLCGWLAIHTASTLIAGVIA